MRTIAFDFETYYKAKKPAYGLRTMLPENYCQHELFDAYMLSVYDGSEKWVGHPRDFNWAAFDGARGVAHNAGFDGRVLQELHARGLAPAPGFAEVHCSANMSAYLCNRRSLADAAEHLLGVKMDKSVRADADGKHWPQDFSPAEQKIMLEYAQKDAITTWELWDKYSPQWPEVERQLSRITIEQGARGVQINTDLLDEYILSSHEAKSATEKQLPWLKDEGDDDEDASWGGFNTKPTSTKCVAEQCRRSGIPCPPVQREDQEGFDEWEAQYSKVHPWITALGAWRSINRLYKMLLVMKSRIRPDGSMPFGLLYFAAHTGRWGGTAKVNLLNMRRKPLFIRTDGLIEMDERVTDGYLDYKRLMKIWPEDVARTIDFRALYIPRPGKKMIVSDLAQIEPRVLAWMSGGTEIFDLLRSGMSLYHAHAITTMGFVGDKMDKTSTTYKLAKARVLALGYGAGASKFILMAQMLAGLDITADDPEWITVTDPFSGVEKKVSGYGSNSKRIVKEWRDSNPKIVGMWKALDENLKRNVGGDFEIELPNGRKMHYDKVRCERRIEPDPETKLPRARSVFTAQIGSRRSMTYGGKLTENVVQATARDLFGEHVAELDRRGYNVLWTAHDEAILEVDNAVTPADIEQVMSVTPTWLAGCPVAAEAKVVPHYTK